MTKEEENLEEAAAMAVDALIDAGIVRERERNKAEAIVREELIVRKSINLL